MRCIANLIAGLVLIVMSAHASAQATRTFVSSNGNDSNDCSRQAPCRSFAVAITKTNADGEINTLDPGGYGPVTITKSISIVSGLGEAGILVPSGGTGITVNAGPSDRINLRGLAIEGANVGATGIRFNSGAALTVTNCVIRNLTQVNIDLQPTGDSVFMIADTLSSDGRVGLYVYPQGQGIARATVSRLIASNNEWGLYGNGNAAAASSPDRTAFIAIEDSIFTNNRRGQGIGLLVSSAKDKYKISLDVQSSKITGNLVGISNAGGTIIIARSQVIFNQTDTTCIDFTTVFSTNDNRVPAFSCLTADSYH